MKLHPPLLLSVFVALAGLAEDRVPLKTLIPRPGFGCGPVPTRVANLEPPQARNGPPALLVTPGVTNLALHAKVSTSSGDPVIGELAQVTDGDKTGEEGSYVELEGGRQWVQIDLGRPASVEAVLVWHFFYGVRVYHDVIVQISGDPEFKQGVTTVFNNDHDNSAGLGVGADKAYIETNWGRWIDAKGSTGRYVRLYSRGSTASDLNRYTEVEVWGQFAK